MHHTSATVRLGIGRHLKSFWRVWWGGGHKYVKLTVSLWNVLFNQRISCRLCLNPAGGLRSPRPSVHGPPCLQPLAMPLLENKVSSLLASTSSCPAGDSQHDAKPSERRCWTTKRRRKQFSSMYPEDVLLVFSILWVRCSLRLLVRWPKIWCLDWRIGRF